VESAQAHSRRRPVVFLRAFLRLPEKEFLRPAQIECRRARPLQAVATHSGRPIVGNGVAIIIAPGRQAVGAARSERNRHPQSEPVARLNRAQYVETMTFV